MLAETNRAAGRLDDGLGALQLAFAVAEGKEQHLWDAELLRLEGELLLAKDPKDPEGERRFDEALERARRQQAKSFELRAACSLARLWNERGEGARARELLAPVYDWFTEGFDTQDLKDAKALLDELA